MRAIPIRRTGTRVNLFMGGDRELVLMSALLAGTAIFMGQTWLSFFFGMGLWFASLYVCRLMSKADPRMRHVYMRHRLYKAFYAARSTPFRVNTSTQARQYR